MDEIGNDLTKYEKRIKDEELMPREWHAHFSRILGKFEGIEREKWVGALLNYTFNVKERMEERKKRRVKKEGTGKSQKAPKTSHLPRQLLEYEVKQISENWAIENPYAKKELKEYQHAFCAILKRDPTLVKAGRGDSQSLLHKAAEEGVYWVIRVIRRQANEEQTKELRAMISQRDDGGKTALQLAVESGSSKSVRELFRLDGRLREDIESNSDDTESNGEAIINMAIQNNNLPILKILLHRFPSAVKIDMLKTAVTNRFTRVLKYLVQQRPNIIDPKESTLLHDAVKTGNEEIVKILISVYPDLTVIYGDENELVLSHIVGAKGENFESIKELVVQTIFKRNLVSTIREHISCISGLYTPFF
jgi:Ankyrin repeats (3 copies)